MRMVINFSVLGAAIALISSCTGKSTVTSKSTQQMSKETAPDKSNTVEFFAATLTKDLKAAGYSETQVAAVTAAAREKAAQAASSSSLTSDSLLQTGMAFIDGAISSIASASITVESEKVASLASTILQSLLTSVQAYITDVDKTSFLKIQLSMAQAASEALPKTGLTGEMYLNGLSEVTATAIKTAKTNAQASDAQVGASVAETVQAVTQGLVAGATSVMSQSTDDSTKTRKAVDAISTAAFSAISKDAKSTDSVLSDAAAAVSAGALAGLQNANISDTQLETISKSISDIATTTFKDVSLDPTALSAIQSVVQQAVKTAVASVQASQKAVSAPTSVTLSVSGGASSAFRSSTLVCTYTSASDSPALTQYVYRWYVDGSVIDGQSSKELQTGFAKGNKVTCGVYALLGAVSSTETKSSSITIKNSAPTAPTVAVSVLGSGNPYKSSTLSCDATGSIDTDGDSVSYLYFWYKNSTLISGTGSSEKILTGTFFNKTDLITCAAMASDGTDSATTVQATAGVTILNSAPSAPTSVTIAETAPNIGSTLHCTSVASSDVDGDTITYTYSWFKNGSTAAFLTNQSTNALAGSFVKGDSIACAMVASDGTSNSTTSSVSGAVSIINSSPAKPTAPSLSASSTPAIKASSFTCTPPSPLSTDADSDSLTATYVWYKNGSVISSQNSSTLGSGNFAKGDSIQCAVFANDGSTSSLESNKSAQIAVSNTAPTVSCSNKSQSILETASPNPAISCSGTDADGDSVTYSVDNSASGCSGISINSSGSVSFTMGTSSCSTTVTVSDGSGTGTDTLALTFQYPSGDFTSNTTISADAHYYNLTVRNGATLTIAGGKTVTVDGTLTVTGNSHIVLQSANRTAQVGGLWVGAGVTINAANVQVDAGSSINADAQGYTSGPGAGAGLNSYDSSGGAYGGAGSANSAATYGSANAPTDLGSASGSAASPASAGGGAIRLAVTGTLTNNGTISANGESTSSYSGGGSGGSIYITAGTLAGTGTITSTGGSRSGSGTQGGGGGRIAVIYTTNSGFNLNSITAAGGSGAGSGTVYVVENGSLLVSAGLVLPADTTLNLTNITVNNSATLTIGGGSTVTLSGKLTVTGTSHVVLKGKNTSAQVSSAWAGAGVTINAANIEIDPNSSINANAQGYTSGPGAGAGLNSYDSSGGAYGGTGGSNSAATYGSISAPTDLGSASGSAASPASAGGGAIRLVVTGTLDNDGTISANGESTTSYSGGGSGGSVYITSGTLKGSGSISATGGTRSGSATQGGGGGRVAVYYTTNDGFLLSNITANGGTGGSSGSVFLVSNGNLTVSAGLELPADTTLNLTNITVNNGATLTIGGGSTITLTGTLTVTASSHVIMKAKNRTAQVSGAWVGAGVTVNAANIQVDYLSSINADAQGYTSGPGAGSPHNAYDTSGGTYGGAGSGNVSSTYGSSTTPTDLGSASGTAASAAAAGGGAIRLAVSGTLTNSGIISSNGESTNNYSGGGSGGSVYITTGTLAGSGSITATGGARAANNSSQGGGGGRVAVYYATNSGFDLTAITANAGPGGGSGSVHLIDQ